MLRKLSTSSKVFWAEVEVAGVEAVEIVEVEVASNETLLSSTAVGGVTGEILSHLDLKAGAATTSATSGPIDRISLTVPTARPKSTLCSTT